MSWTVEYYKESGRNSYPIKEFLDAIDDKAAAKFFRCFALLEEHGIEVREPYVKSLTGHGKLKEMAHPQNLWVSFGSGKLPRV